ncbi:head-tail connector protein [Aeromonas veronii]|uniref:head-tail connector protein n=1 Tax=Aeromonas veronii TaxID=654 RepID=UPI001F22DF7A|nr:head-tail connector protein [Aeromonas veronii]MCF5884717.1 head-tail connector protein [Aeromonas veronii]
MITLELVKEHLRLNPSDTSEDNIITLYIDAAIDAASHPGRDRTLLMKFEQADRL